MTTIPGLLAFAARAKQTTGFGYLLADGSVDTQRGIETWINARMTHSFSLAVLMGRDDFAPLAEHGLEALRTELHDADHGGWWTSTLEHEEKSAYEHAFVILAAASASIAGLPDAKSLLTDALSVWDNHFWDDDAGAAVDKWDPSWSVCENYRGANANMHAVEAMLAAADALPASALDLRNRCRRVVERFVDGEARQRAWRLPEHYDASWQADLDCNRERPTDAFRPYGVTVGHQFEWARLAVHVQAALGPEAPNWLLEDSQELYRAAQVRGWSSVGSGGFVYTLDWKDHPVVAERFHWVLAEAISAASVMGRVTGDEMYRRDQRRWEELAEAVFYDPATGNWRHEVDPYGAPSAVTWSGQPDIYHVLQALLLPLVPITGSVAGSLVEAGPTR